MDVHTPETVRDTADIGVFGLAVMGSNLARNFARHGHTVAVHNRTPARIDKFIADHGDDGKFVPSAAVEDFVASLKRPRRILMMVKAGAPTDATIDHLVPLLEPGDILVDGGNAHFEDTRRLLAQFTTYPAQPSYTCHWRPSGACLPSRLRIHGVDRSVSAPTPTHSCSTSRQRCPSARSSRSRRSEALV